MKAYNLSISEIIKRISNPQGLNSTQVEKSKIKYGSNVMTKKGQKSLLKRIVDAFFEPMLIILEVAFVITLGVYIANVSMGKEGDLYECLGIFFAMFSDRKHFQMVMLQQAKVTMLCRSHLLHL